MFANLLALIRKRRLDLELDDEIRAHLELAQKDAITRGLTPEEARREARRSFGGIEQMKEAHRDQRSFRWIETLLRDLRYGFASLLRSPGFTAVVVGVLALGIGGTVAMFSVVDAVLLKPLPFRQADRIVGVWEAPRPGAVNAATVPQFVAWRRQRAAFDALAAEEPIQVALAEKNGAARLAGKAVTADYFKIFTTGVALGRTFTPEDDRPGAAPVVVLSHGAWEAYFGGDPGILRRRVILDGDAYQVIGVLQSGPFDRDETQFWKPLIFTTQDQSANDVHWLTVYGRINAAATLAQARERMQSVYAALAGSAPIEERGGAIVIQPLKQLLVGSNLERSISVAFGAVFLVLLIACANIANLLFARGAMRRTELAVRAALGASRWRLVAQLLTESVALCVLGGAAGVAAAWFLIRLVRPFLSQSIPFTADVNLNLHVLLFAAAAVLGVAMLAGIVPALEASFGNLTNSLKQSARGSSVMHIRVRRTIVMGEVALSLVLVCGFLLLTRSLLKLQQLDAGARVANVITMSADLPAGAYSTSQRAALFYGAVAQRLRSIPGIERAGLSTYLPFEWISNGEGMQVAGAEKLVRVRFKRVDPGYFSTLDIPVLSGRGITNSDREGAPRVVVINQALVAGLADAGMKDPVGKTVRLSSTDYTGHEPLMLNVQIIGVIRSERTSSPGRPDPAVVYVPLAQAPSPHIKLLVRTYQGTAAIMPSIRQAVREADPSLPLGDVATMQQVRDRTLIGISRPASLIGAFALVAVFLAGIGLYGVISYSVTQRRPEFGIRMALGARPGDLLSEVLRGALTMVAAGLLFGLVGVFALTRVLASLLYEVSPLDPLALTIACAAMVLIGLLAGFLPANRAAHVDPIATLRNAG